jgi:transposase
MPKPTWSNELKSIVEALFEHGHDNFHIETITKVPQSTLRRWKACWNKYGQIDAPIKANGRPPLLTDEALDV